MGVMLSEIYDALLDAGANEPKARLAAERLAELRDGQGRIENETRDELSKMRLENQTLREDLRREMADLRTEMRTEMREMRHEYTSEQKLMRWMLGILIALSIAGFVRSFF